MFFNFIDKSYRKCKKGNNSAKNNDFKTISGSREEVRHDIYQQWVHEKYEMSKIPIINTGGVRYYRHQQWIQGKVSCHRYQY